MTDPSGHVAGINAARPQSVSAAMAGADMHVTTKRKIKVDAFIGLAFLLWSFV
jgi:hypothetical protein